MRIDAFLESDVSSECKILRDLYQFMSDNDDDRDFYIEGLTLLDIEPYGGTILYDPRMTPVNTMTFACTGGDDVHFGMLASHGLYGDSSPIVMTVPMADENPQEANFIVGENLHDFLRVGCAHGYGRLECLAYSWQHELFDLLAGPEDDDPSYAKYRSALSLTPWNEVQSRQSELDARFKHSLKYKE